MECFPEDLQLRGRQTSAGRQSRRGGGPKAGCGGESVYATCSAMGFTCAIDGDDARRTVTRARGTAWTASRAEATADPGRDSQNGPRACFQGSFRTRPPIWGNRSSRKTVCCEYCPKPDSWNRRFRHPWSGYCWGAEIFISAYRRKRSGVHYCRGEQHGRSPTEIRHATQLVYVPIGALTCPGPVAPDGVTSPSELAGDVVAANLSRWLSTIRRTKVSDTSTRPL